jgi:acyl-coenzyme A thioesterase PaaI-like protein
MTPAFDPELAMAQSSVIRELGLRTEAVGDVLRGDARVTPEMWVPGTQVIRTSVLAVWADSVTGLLAGFSMQPRITVTLDLDLHLRWQPVGTGTVRLAASVVKAGRNVIVTRVELTFGDEPRPFAVGHGSFMASPNPDHVMEGGFPLSLPGWRAGALPAPLAERAGVRHLEPGVAEVPWRPGNLNATESIQGGLVALAVEEAALSAAEAGTVVTSLTLRYLRPFRSRSALARADVHDGVASVEVEADAGKPGAVATARLGPAAGSRPGYV